MRRKEENKLIEKVKSIWLSNFIIEAQLKALKQLVKTKGGKGKWIVK